MITKFKLTRVGFGTSVSVGDCFRYQKDVYCIVSVGNIEKAASWCRDQAIFIEVLAQKENTYKDIDRYELPKIVKQRFVIKDKDKEIWSCGDFVKTYADDDTSMYMQVTSIVALSYDFVDLYCRVYSKTYL